MLSLIMRCAHVLPPTCLTSCSLVLPRFLIFDSDFLAEDLRGIWLSQKRFPVSGTSRARMPASIT